MWSSWTWSTMGQCRAMELPAGLGEYDPDSDRYTQHLLVRPSRDQG